MRSQADPEWLLDKIDLWHNGDGEKLTLAQYLGWTDEEYARFVEEGELPAEGDREPLPTVLCAVTNDKRCAVDPPCPSNGERACVWESPL